MFLARLQHNNGTVSLLACLNEDPHFFRTIHRVINIWTHSSRVCLCHLKQTTSSDEQGDMPYKPKKPKHKAQEKGAQKSAQLLSTVIHEALNNLKLEAVVPVTKPPTSKAMTTSTAPKLDTAPSTSNQSAHPKPNARKRRERRTVDACHAARGAKSQRTPEDIAAKDKGWKYYDVYKLCGKEVADEWEEYGKQQGK